MIDLNHVHLGLHDYMRLLEQAVIETCAEFGIAAGRDAAATGVWVDVAKICAMGVRVRKWVTMHGLALNVTTNLDHFGLIVPCGLAQREVTSMQRLLGQYCPAMSAVKRVLSDRLTTLLQAAASAAEEKRTLSSSHGAA